jgi:hypothetical protein
MEMWQFLSSVWLQLPSTGEHIQINIILLIILSLWEINNSFALKIHIALFKKE